VKEVSPANGGYEISLVEGSDPAGAIREIAAAVPTARVELHRPTLEDIFIQIVTGEGKMEADDLARLRAELREETGAEVAR
jgi:hypothetical protein